MLEQLAAQSTAANQLRSVTGYLYRQNDFFTQYIEGSRSMVLDLMGRIEKDKRHEVLFSLQNEGLMSRRFPEWSMRWIRKEELAEINTATVLTDLLRYMSALDVYAKDETSRDRLWGVVDALAKTPPLQKQ